jgi:hypothetical protein
MEMREKSRLEIALRQRFLVIHLVLALLLVRGRPALRSQRGAMGRGFSALAVGFIVTLVGFVVIIYEIWTTSTIPLNDYTFAGIALAGIGIAVGAVGLDRGVSVTG